MILNIVSEYKITSDLENMYISANMLRLPTTHLFIASNTWDKAVIEITNSIPEGTLTNLYTVCKDIKVVLPSVLDEHSMRVLTELYPDKAGTIRKYFLLGKCLKGVIPCAEHNQ